MEQGRHTLRSISDPIYPQAIRRLKFRSKTILIFILAITTFSLHCTEWCVYNRPLDKENIPEVLIRLVYCD